MSRQPVLVLGGGQLGLMMAEAATHLGVTLDRVDTNSDELIPGTSGLRLPTDANQLSSRYSMVTAEMEHLPDTDLVNGLRKTDLWLNKRAFDILPSRYQQKQLLDDIGVANAPWQLLQSREDLSHARELLGQTLIVKTTRGGYDGKGQWVVEDDVAEDIPSSMFGQLIAEQKVDFSREVSLVGSRARNGETFFYPLAENYHHQGILRYSVAPANDPLRLQTKAEQMLKVVMEELDYIGIMAMECFETADDLMVNELAPRVHNSGHWTQSGALCSQFDLHMRALSDIPFPKHASYRKTLMLNLIGCEYDTHWHTLDGIYCYWYGKERRGGRKLGHINIIGETNSLIRERAALLMPQLDLEHQKMLEKGLNRLE